MSKTKETPDFLSMYRLQIADGHRWHLMADRKNSCWMDHVASTMQLKPISNVNSDCPRILFLKNRCSSGSKSHDPFDRFPQWGENLSREDWKETRLDIVKMWFRNDLTDCIFEFNGAKGKEIDIQRMMLSLHPLYHHTILRGGLVLHGALTGLNQQGIVLCAPSNTGKSTCCRRLPPPWEVLGDEEALIIRDEEGLYYAHPLPTWSNLFHGKGRQSWNVEKHYPLKAVFFLVQGETDMVVPIGAGDAAVQIFEAALQKWPVIWKYGPSPEASSLRRRKLFENACSLARSIPAYMLHVSMKGRFWEKMEEVLLQGCDYTANKESFKVTKIQGG